MRHAARIFGWTLVFLVLADLFVAVFLDKAAPGALVRFFDYGRSVPGKIAEWKTRADTPGNLLTAAWRPEMLTASAAKFRDEAEEARHLRIYGMSFVNHIADAAVARRPGLVLDSHSGPAAPPNFTYSMFLQDRPNRRAGDVAVLGVLSSSVAAMASFSNRVWSFEQPAPFTYPVFLPDGAEGLRAIEPVIETLEQEKTLASNPQLRARWRAQLRAQDALYSPAAFALPLADLSPFARLVRRAWATAAIRDRSAAVQGRPEGGPYPWAVVLRRMAVGFAETARRDGQIPVVVLVQTRNPADPDLLHWIGPELDRAGIPYLATAAIQPPDDLTAFVPDGHYRDEVNRRFAAAFLDLLDANRPGQRP